MLETLFVSTWPWYVAGPLIGLYAVAFFYMQRRNLGASSSFPALIEAWRGEDDPRQPDLSRLDDALKLPGDPRDKAPRWRVWWLAGMVAAGSLAWALGGEGTGGAHLPGWSEHFRGWPLWAELGLLFGGGLCIGFGTRMSGGCTSGHAIFGISQRQLPSLAATCVFMGVGVLVTWVIELYAH
jgi:uncharacterized membrane protein YedE/YeeE